jgi:hypothetical protein
MTERQMYQRYTEAYADWDAIPSYYNAQAVHRWALKLASISDDYDHLLDEATDILWTHSAKGARK